MIHYGLFKEEEKEEEDEKDLLTGTSCRRKCTHGGNMQIYIKIEKIEIR